VNEEDVDEGEKSVFKSKEGGEGRYVGDQRF